MNYIRTDIERIVLTCAFAKMLSYRETNDYMSIGRNPKKNNHDPSPHISEIKKMYRPVSTIARTVL